MIAVPPDIPVTTPVAEPAVALVLPLLHVPPTVASIKVTVDPAHIADTPVIAEGTGFTVMVVEVVQPVGNE